MGKQIAGQLSIFDWMPSVIKCEFPDINEVTETEAVRIIGENVGLLFSHRDEFWGWQAKQSKLTIRLKYGRFRCDNHERFLGVDCEMKNEGCSCPCSGIEEALKLIRRWIKRAEEKS